MPGGEIGLHLSILAECTLGEALVGSHASLAFQKVGGLTEKANALVRLESNSTQMVAVQVSIHHL